MQLDVFKRHLTTSTENICNDFFDISAVFRNESSAESASILPVYLHKRGIKELTLVNW